MFASSMNNLTIPQITRLLNHYKAQTFYPRLMNSKILKSAYRIEDRIRSQAMNFNGLLVQ